MVWRFEPGEDLQKAFRRAAAEEIARIRESLSGVSEDKNAAIHSARQGFKRLRALTRLAKPQLGEGFERENLRWRDAGRLLSGARDTTVLLQTFDKLIADCGGKVPADGVRRLRSRVAKRGPRNGRGALDVEQVEDALRILDDAEHAVSSLRWPKTIQSLAGGLKQGQRRLRRKWRKASESSEADALHAWRKCVKDQAAQLRLFRRVLTGSLRDRRNEEKETAELLGGEHDLWLLNERLGEMTLPPALAVTRDVLCAEIGGHRDKLRRAAFEKGEPFSSEKPKAFAATVRDAWVKASKRKPKKKLARHRRASERTRPGLTSPAP
jgi:CHAD domain-containing protein